MPGAGSSRRFTLILLFVSGFVTILFISAFRSVPEGIRHPNALRPNNIIPPHHVDVQSSTLTGHAIAPKLGNETAKAELGRAAWKLFHTVFARFPDKPTADERTALQSYIHLFQRLYPCGECAEHFRAIIDKFPPQVSSRSAAAAWGCHVHNEVNKSLGKELFDCSKIGDFYDCGCAEDEDGSQSGGEKEKDAEGMPAMDSGDKPEMSAERKEKIAGTNGREVDDDILSGARPLQLEKEG